MTDISPIGPKKTNPISDRKPLISHRHLSPFLFLYFFLAAGSCLVALPAVIIKLTTRIEKAIPTRDTRVKIKAMVTITKSDEANRSVGIKVDQIIEAREEEIVGAPLWPGIASRTLKPPKNGAIPFSRAQEILSNNSFVHVRSGRILKIGEIVEMTITIELLGGDPKRAGLTKGDIKSYPEASEIKP